MTGFGLNRAVSGLTQGGEQASASKDKAALVLGQGAMWPWLWELAQRTERLAYEASSPAAPWYVSLFSRRTADGPKRKPLPWRRRWHWLRSSCEPGGRSRKSAAPWAVSGELRPRDPGWDGACPWEVLGTSPRDQADPDAGLRSKRS